MIIRKTLFILTIIACVFQPCYAQFFAEKFKYVGFVELCDKKNGAATFESLYQYFDAFIDILRKTGLGTKIIRGKRVLYSLIR